MSTFLSAHEFSAGTIEERERERRIRVYSFLSSMQRSVSPIETSSRSLIFFSLFLFLTLRKRKRRGKRRTLFRWTFDKPLIRVKRLGDSDMLYRSAISTVKVDAVHPPVLSLETGGTLPVPSSEYRSVYRPRGLFARRGNGRRNDHRILFPRQSITLEPVRLSFSSSSSSSLPSFNLFLAEQKRVRTLSHGRVSLRRRSFDDLSYSSKISLVYNVESFFKFDSILLFATITYPI